jgi:hypothetical protein
MAVGAYLSRAPLQADALWAAMALTSVLWICLYALNECSDLILEHRADVGRSRQAALIALPLIIAAASTFVSSKLPALLLLMVATQVAYSLPPLRWKRHWELIVLVSGVINPVLRLLSGAAFGDQPIPAVAFATLVLLHLGGTLRTRQLRRERDRSLGYRVAPGMVHYPGVAATILGLCGICVMCQTAILPRVFGLFAAAGLLFAVHAWSGRTQEVTVLRKAWVLFAALLPLLLLSLRR